jgi:hypothetical protein
MSATDGRPADRPGRLIVTRPGRGSSTLAVTMFAAERVPRARCQPTESVGPDREDQSMGSRRLQRELIRERADHAVGVRERHGTIALRILLLESHEPGADHAQTVGMEPAEFLTLLAALIDDLDARAYAPDALDRLSRRLLPPPADDPRDG